MCVLQRSTGAGKNSICCHRRGQRAVAGTPGSRRSGATSPVCWTAPAGPWAGRLPLACRSASRCTTGP